MKRSDRKHWKYSDLGLDNKTEGVFGLVDESICSYYFITLDELDYIAEHATDEELEIMVDATTFTDKRKQLEIRNKYVQAYSERDLANS